VARVRTRSSQFRLVGAAVLVLALATPIAACGSGDPERTSGPAELPVTAAPAVPAVSPDPSEPVPAGTPQPPAATFSVGDLAIESDAEEIVPGDDVMVTANVRNTGVVAGTYEAWLTINGSLFVRQLVDLPGGESAILRFPVTAGMAGDYEFRLGEALMTMSVLAPAAFTLSDLSVAPNPVEVGDRFKATVTVANTGGQSGTQPVRLKVDGKTVATKDTTLAGGQQSTVTISVKAPGAGRHTVAVGDLRATLTVVRIQRQANGKVLVNKVGGGMGRLTVKNGGSHDAVVLLAKSSKPSKTLLAVYVRAGKSATVKGIRDGTYVVWFATGTRWDTHSRTFTSSRELRRFEDTMRFRTTRTSTYIKYSIWKVTLNATSGGNAPTSSVGDDGFPGVP
jgi:CARDB